MEGRENDFTKGSVAGNIVSLAVPMTVAQLINILYNVVDRIYIGHIPGAGTLALTGIGLTFPVITIITGFANLFGMGGAPLCSIARGEGNIEKAEKIMGNSFTLLWMCGALLTLIGLLIKDPLLYAFGASAETFPYAQGYLSVYLAGSIFVMISLGMNGFINSQGFGKIGMATVLIGALANLILDPLFIFVFRRGVQGAAAATVLSQALSAFWVLRFLRSKKAILTLKKKAMFLKPEFVKRITALGLSSFVMSLTNSLVQIVCNANLKVYGGDIYVGVMTVINSVREVLSMPAGGLTNGAQPVIGYNYGAGEMERVKKSIRFMTVSCVIYTTFSWLLVLLIPQFLIRLFNSSPQLLKAGVPAMHVYFFGFCFMALQFSGQSAFLALGRSKEAIFFSLFRKVIIVVPLTILLPKAAGLGVTGVFLAEPISNVIGGCASFLTMIVCVWKRLSPDYKSK